MSTFEELEQADGVRLSWQYWRPTKASQGKLAVPPAALVTLLKDLPHVQPLPYAPVLCRGCKSALNCYCAVDHSSKQWTCSICSQRQPLPPAYHGISPECLPGELYPNANVVEHMLPGTANQTRAPVCLFVLDLCVSAEDLEHMKLAVEQAITMLPDSTLVGVITFGSMVYVHEMAAGDMPSCVMFRGSRELAKMDLLAALGFNNRAQRGMPPGGSHLMALGDCSFAVESVLQGMQPEAAPAPSQRVVRCTGAALAVAVALLEAYAPNSGGRAMLFTAGPCTRGPGQVVGADFEDAIRTHKDLVKGAAKWYSKASAVYDRLARRIVDAGHCLDIFACSLDQTGLSEMQHMVTCTGGVMVMAETFDHSVFKRSLAKLLRTDSSDEHLTWALNATVEVAVSPGIGVAGAIGPLASLERPEGVQMADTPVGLGATAAWKLNALDSGTTLAFYFQVMASEKKAPPEGSPLSFQVRTTYQHASGHRRVRLCTVSRYWSAPTTVPAQLGFDQEAAAIVIARMVAYSTEQDQGQQEVMKWIDRSLISLTKQYTAFSRDVVESVAMPPEFAAFPEYIFHLRRSAFVDVFNNTPDETVFYRLLLFRETCASCMLMLQPQLWCYPVDGSDVHPVTLDVASINPDAVMLLDSWFNVVVHTGSHVAAWIKAGVLEDPAYAHVKAVVAAAHAEAERLLSERNPLPRLVVCDQGTSQARFLLVRLNPSRTQENSDASALGTSDSVIYTDDVSYLVFLEQLKRLTVAG